ncbi:hypothetical protein J2S53_001217 [Actinopolyspora lacussalsi]|nr:hypothetical protein [Actinopolyspora lacussalsi]
MRRGMWLLGSVVAVGVLVLGGWGVVRMDGSSSESEPPGGTPGTGVVSTEVERNEGVPWRRLKEEGATFKDPIEDLRDG